MDRIKSYSLSRDIETSECTGYKYIHYGDIHKKVADIVDENSNLPNIKVGNYELLEKGDLILADASEDYEGIATPALINVDLPYKVVAGLHTIALRPKQVNPLFLYFMILSPRFRKYGYRVGTGMKVFGISVNNLLKFENGFPSLEEQGKIADFLIQLDKTIALHQRKLDKLKQLKQAYLQALFPQGHENSPKVRFANFEGDWEHRKLGDVSNIVGGGTPSTSNEEYWGGDIDWYSPVDIGEQIYIDSSKKKITKLGLQKSSAKVLPIGTILFTSRAGIGNTAILAKEGATNQGFQSILPHKSELDSYFIYSRSHELKRYGETNGAGSTFVEVSGIQMSKMPILIPQLEEQIKVGEFFKGIDNTILHYQKKSNSLKELKKLYLQKLFV